MVIVEPFVWLTLFILSSTCGRTNSHREEKRMKKKEKKKTKQDLQHKEEITLPQVVVDINDTISQSNLPTSSTHTDLPTLEPFPSNPPISSPKSTVVAISSTTSSPRPSISSPASPISLQPLAEKVDTPQMPRPLPSGPKPPISSPKSPHMEHASPRSSPRPSISSPVSPMTNQFAEKV